MDREQEAAEALREIQNAGQEAAEESVESEDTLQSSDVQEDGGDHTHISDQPEYEEVDSENEETTGESEESENRIPQSRLNKEVAKRKSLEEELTRIRHEFELMKQRQELTQQGRQVPQEPEQAKGPLAQYTDEQLEAYANMKPELRGMIDKELRSRSEDRIRKELRAELQAEKQRNEYDKAAIRDYPELSDPNSELTKMTNQLYQSNQEYAKYPAGWYAAAQAAFNFIARKRLAELESRGSKQVSEKKKASVERDKLKKKLELENSTRRVIIPTSEEELEKLRELATERGVSSPEWLRLMKAEEKLRKQKASQ